MKIIFFTSEKPELPGAKRCHILANELRKSGINTEVISTYEYTNTDIPNDIQKIRSQLKIYNRIRYENKDTIFILQRVGYHVLAPLLFKKNNKNPLFLDVDDWALDANVFRGISIIKGLNITSLWENVLEESNACTVISNNLKEFLSQYHQYIYLLPPLMQSVTENYEVKVNDIKTAFAFCWLGTIYRKDDIDNVKFLIKAFLEFKKHLENENRIVLLEIVGGGPRFEEIKEENKNSDIKIRGWINGNDLEKYMEGIDVGLVPLLQDSKYNFYKTPTKLFDFMRFGKPIIVSNIGETAYLVNKMESGLVAENSLDEWVEALTKIYKDRLLREKIANKNLFAMKNDYSLKKLINSFKKIIEYHI